ncbi:MAG: hypothetical protein HUJ29_11630 [Gammaproteobacteria bacterium]|nr:hypothetical protein [Gammaproteobacteria bacterium]
MHFIGKLTVYLGLIMVVAGLAFGFSAMATDADSSAIQWIGLVPFGFLLLLTGTVMTQLSRPK